MKLQMPSTLLPDNGLISQPLNFKRTIKPSSRNTLHTLNPTTCYSETLHTSVATRASFPISNPTPS
jgi:hypothetical protein